MDTALAIPGKATKVGLQLAKNTTFDEWKKVGEHIQEVEHAVMWWLGDWWAFGEQAYGERASQVTEEQNFQTLMNAGWVSNSIETSRRREVLSWSIHAEVAALEPDEQDALLDKAQTENWTVRDMRQAARIVKAHRVAKTQEKLPTNKYRVFYADPPWKYGNENLQQYGHASYHYPTMSIDELCDLPVQSAAQDNAVLFLWVTSPLLEECFSVIKAWGFSYKTSFVWDKIKHNFGHYNSVRHELLLVCTRGSCTPDIATLVDSVQTIERSKTHSEKPEEFRAIIETLYPKGERIELFARKKVSGWHSWGNELAA